MSEPWVQTHSCKAVSLVNPDPAAIDVKDIAVQLSLIQRYSGAVRYSVARHSAWVAKVLLDRGFSREVVLQGLLHDAHEAYMGDITGPVRKAIGLVVDSYYNPVEILEKRLQRAVMQAFRLPTELHPAVDQADRDAVLVEWYWLHARMAQPWGFSFSEAYNLVATTPTVCPSAPRAVGDEALFLWWYKYLNGTADTDVRPAAEP